MREVGIAETSFFYIAQTYLKLKVLLPHPSVCSIITNYNMFLISNILCLFLDQFYYTFVFFSSFLGMGNDFF